MISDDSASPFDYTTQEFMRQDVRKILEKLKPKEREVLSLRFGLEDGQELSDAPYVAMKLNLNREQVIRIQIKAKAHRELPTSFFSSAGLGTCALLKYQPLN